MSSGFRKVKPTKSNLDKLKNRRLFVDRGSHMLELKREQVLNRLKKDMKHFFEEKQNVNEIIYDAYEKLNESYMNYGKRRIKLLSQFNRLQYEPEVKIDYVNEMGIDVPVIDLKILEKETLPPYSFQDTPVVFDEMVSIIKKSLDRIIKLAKLDYIIFHGAFSYQITKRRISALEDHIIPQLDQDIHQISEILEDLEREEYIRMKFIKDKIHQKKEN